jgi:DNA-binding transcriptional LysR family regulator
MLPAQIEAFVAVAEQGTLRGAAASLHLTQPALTARIQSLEAQLRAPLFRRRRTGMELTHAGRAFLPYAERALDALRGGAALVSELAEGVIGELAIGAAPSVGSYVLPELLARYLARSPNVRLVVRTGHTEQLVDMVVAGEVDVAVTRRVRDQRVTSRPLYEDELVLVVPPGHPFATAGRVDVSAIARELLILFDRASSYHELTNALFRAAGVESRGVLEVDSIDAAKRMVQRGVGVALLPGTAVADAIADGSLSEVDLIGAGSIRRRIVALERLGAHDQPAPLLDFMTLLTRIPELIPRARTVRQGAPTTSTIASARSP